MSKNKLTSDQIKKILKLSKKGLSERAIAKEVGCSRSAVWYRINKDAK